MIIAKHMEIPMNLEAVSSLHDLKGLRHLYNLVESHTRGLASLGVRRLRTVPYCRLYRLPSYPKSSISQSVEKSRRVSGT